MVDETGRGVLLWLAYDGTEFSGMAKQTNGRTVAGELEGAIRTMDPRASAVRNVSRTDRGVHALDQVVAFDTKKDISARGWLLGLTGHLPASIAIVRAASVPAGFEPRGHVVHKTYRYRILQSKVRDPFLDNSAWRIEQRLNLDLMRAEANDLVGTHDFAAFRGAQDQRPETNRTIFHATLQPDPADRRILWIEINGNKFLYHMVRIIVGTLVDVGRGRTNPGAVRTALASLNRNDLGMTAPPQGLFLSHIQLDEPVADAWPAADDSITTT
jgi:tRNA pseudouridine38-40 synthase